jgi:hypothetical protein
MGKGEGIRKHEKYSASLTPVHRKINAFMVLATLIPERGVPEVL